MIREEKKVERQNHHGQRSNARASGFWWIKNVFRIFPKRSGQLKTNAAVSEKQTMNFCWPKIISIFPAQQNTLHNAVATGFKDTK